MPLVKMKIDGIEVEAEKDAPILEAIRKLGIEVPTLCSLEGLEPYGACRMCLVEATQRGRTRLVTSCNFGAREGLEVETHTERVQHHRQVMAELLLAKSPDVPMVQDLAASLGVAHSRFKTAAETSQCIQCGLCVRVCDEVVGASALSFVGRGATRSVGTPFDVDPDACIACGACTYVCPTGAIQMEAQTKARWRKERGTSERVCRYARLGLVSYKLCPNNFDCAHCEVDQQLFDEYGTHPALALAPAKHRRPHRVGHFDLVEDRFYYPAHAWVKYAGERARVGLDDLAQRLLGEADEVSVLPRPGDVVTQGTSLVTVHAGGHTTGMPSPVSGKVLRVNPMLSGEPSLLNADCYDRGWICVIQPEDAYQEAKELVSPEAASQWMQQESDRLMGALSASGGASLSDGGALLPNFSRSLSDVEWARLARLFLSKTRSA